ncbi:MAG: T9SS type A sorting domain-containing protein [bacterium]|nr:T9SS type A sorting domain-containing protein [bacterium]
MQILIKIAFVFLPVLASAQISFYRNYSDNSYDFGQGIVQLEDSSYVIAGTSGSFTAHGQAFLMLVDSLGNKKWSNHFGGQENEWGKRVLYKENFGFFLCGHSNSYGAGDYDFYLVKVDDSGFEEWSNSYGDGNWERLMDAALTRDTGAILVGEKQNGTFGTDMFLVRTDKNGDTLWTKTLENPGDDIAMTVDIYQDSLLYVGGSRFYADSAQAKGIIYKIHDNGQMLDTLFFKSYPGEYQMNDLHIIGDTVQALGSHRNGSSDQWDYTFYRSNLTVNGFSNISCFNSNVDGDWYGDVFTSYGDNSKRYMAMSSENVPNSPNVNGTDISVQLGNTFMFYQNSVGFIEHEEPDVNGEFIRTSDGGAMLVGYIQSPLVGNGGGTIFLLKIGPGEDYPTTNAGGFSAVVNVAEQFNSLEVEVYPNPAEDWLHIQLPTSDAGTYQLTNVSGQVVKAGSILQEMSLSTSSLPSGVYLLQVATANGKAINRIVIQ